MMKLKYDRLTEMALVFAALLAVSVTAFAQESDEDEDEENAKLEDLVTITTVDRREQNVQDYAGSAQVFNQEQLDSLGVGDEFTNLQYVVPGAVISNQEGNVNVTIRGVGSADNTELIDSSVANHFNGVYLPRARGIGAMFFDLERVEVNRGPQGTKRGRNAVGGTVNIIPAKPSTLENDYAFGAEFGNESLRTFEGMYNWAVSDEFAVRAAFFSRDSDSYFNNVGTDTLTAAGELDEFSGRVSALWQPSDQTSLLLIYDRIDEGGTGYPGLNFFDSLNAGFDVDDLDDGSFDGIYRGEQGFLDSVHQGFMADFTHEFDSFTFQYVGSYRDLDFNQTNASNDGVFFPGSLDGADLDNFSNVYWITQSESQTHELRFFGSSGSLDWSAGLFYFDEEQQIGFLSTADNSFCCFSGVEFTFPDVDGDSTAAYGEVIYNFSEDRRFVAGLRFTDEHKSRFGVGGNYGFAAVNAGFTGQQDIRFSTEGFAYNPFARGSFVAPGTGDLLGVAQFLSAGVTFGQRDNLADLFQNCVIAPSDACTADDFQLNGQTLINQIGEYNDDYVDFKLGYEWNPNPNQLIYATISSAHKSGGFNDSFFDPAGNLLSPDFEPEFLVSYELGSKNVWGDVTLNGSLFYYDYEDYVLTSIVAIGEPAMPGDTPPSSAQRSNVGTAEVFGLDLDGSWQINENYKVGGNLLLMSAEFDDATVTDSRQGFGANPNVDLSGNDLPLASDFNLNLYFQGVYYIEAGSVDFTLSSSTRSDYYLSAFNSQGFDSDGNPVPLIQTPNNGGENQGLGFSDEVDGYSVFNLTLGYTNRNGNFRLEGYVNNLTEEVVSTKSILAPNLNLRFLNNPRTAGLRLRYSF